MRWLSRIVTYAVIFAVIVAVGMCVRRKMPATQVGDKFMTCARFRDGSRLSVGSYVLIAGVRVGEITHLRIDGEFARIDMRLQDGVDVPADSWITKRALSPFGDSYLEIIPTGGEQGAPSAQRLKSGECLTRVIEGSSTDRMLRAIDDVMPKVVSGLDRIHEVSFGGREWALGTLGDRMLDADKWLDEGHIDRPLDKADQAIRTMESAVVGASNAVNGARGKLDDTLDRVQRGVAAARKQMAEAQVSLHDGMQGIREGMNGLDQPVDDLAEVIEQVNEGRGSGPRGTLGRLINDPSTADSIESTAESGKEFFESATRFKSYLGLRTEFNVLSQAPRFFVTAEVRARPDKFYYIELERGPLGDVPDDSLTNSIGTNVWTRHQGIHDRIRYTFQFGKELASWLQIRAGIKESTFGAGADVLLRKGKLKLSADVYGAITNTPRVKLAAALLVFRSIYIVGGIDDALNKSHSLIIRKGDDVPVQFDKIRYGRDYFLGAELHFDDEDLSFLLRVYGAMLVGLL